MDSSRKKSCFAWNYIAWRWPRKKKENKKTSFLGQWDF